MLPNVEFCFDFGAEVFFKEQNADIFSLADSEGCSALVERLLILPAPKCALQLLRSLWMQNQGHFLLCPCSSEDLHALFSPILRGEELVLLGLLRFQGLCWRAKVVMAFLANRL